MSVVFCSFCTSTHLVHPLALPRPPSPSVLLPLLYPPLQLLVLSSGQVLLDVGGLKFDVTPGVPRGMLQEATIVPAGPGAAALLRKATDEEELDMPLFPLQGVGAGAGAGADRAGSRPRDGRESPPASSPSSAASKPRYYVTVGRVEATLSVTPNVDTMLERVNREKRAQGLTNLHDVLGELQYASNAYGEAAGIGPATVTAGAGAGSGSSLLGSAAAGSGSGAGRPDRARPAAVDAAAGSLSGMAVDDGGSGAQAASESESGSSAAAAKGRPAAKSRSRSASVAHDEGAAASSSSVAAPAATGTGRGSRSRAGSVAKPAEAGAAAAAPAARSGAGGRSKSIIDE